MSFDVVLVCCAAFLAGLIDSVVGGGGLIQLPALFIVFPAWPPALVLGTNKLASMAGTAVSTYRFQRKLQIDVTPLWYAILGAAIASAVGSLLTGYLNPQILKPVVFALLIFVWIFLSVRSEFGTLARAVFSFDQIRIRAAVLGILVGGYDGFFGPGTGTWLIIGFISFIGFDFLRASAAAKMINLATNAASVCSFAYLGSIDLRIGIMLAVCNVGGSLLGSMLALKHGSSFVRKLFLIVVGMLICRFGWDLFHG